VSDHGSETGNPTSCGPDGVVVGPVPLRTPQDVEALAGCSVVDGDVFIDPCQVCAEDVPDCWDCGPPDALTSLAGLQSLERITGTLVVGSVDSDYCVGHQRLSSLEGLDGLREVGFALFGCSPGLTSARLPALERAGDTEWGGISVEAEFPAQLDLPSLKSARGVWIWGRQQTSPGMPALEVVWDWLVFYDTNIASLDGLQALREVHGLFRLQLNDTLISLGPIGDIPVLGGVRVDHTSGVREVVLYEVTALSKWIAVSHNDAVERIAIPHTVSQIRAVSISDNPVLSSLELPGLEEIDEILEISYNPSLTSLEGLSALQRVGGMVEIRNNPALCQSDVDAFVASLEIGEGAWAWTTDNADC
jgi:hypothetical protein